MTIRSEAEATVAIEDWFTAALRAVDPATAVEAHLRYDGHRLLVDDRPLPFDGRLFVVAVGKAALSMAAGAAAACGAAIDAGLILTKEGHLFGRIPQRFQAFEAGHPIPDERGVAATKRLLELLSEYGEGDVVLALISGGGSALLEAPLEGVSLDDLAKVTDLLLKAGAPIQDLNAVRMPLSRVKGGGLRRAAPAARFATLILSDVLSNDTRVIASGPTVPADVAGSGALELLERYGLTERVPPTVTRALRATAGTSDRTIFAGDVVAIVGDNAAAVGAFAQAANAEGIANRVLWRGSDGEASALARDWVADCLAIEEEIDLLLGGGEATVTVRGDGAGGRNTEFALAAALELERRRRPDIVVGSLATDGQDALTGVAGAIASMATLERARAAGVDPEEALSRNDSLSVFRAAGGCIAPGPTGTNVNDIYIWLKMRG